MKIQYFCYPLLKHVWLFSQKIKSHQAFNLFQFLFSCRACQVAPQSKQGHVGQKACHTALASNKLLLRWTEILPTQGICKEAPLATRINTICSCLFCHTNFINHSQLMKSVQEPTQNLRYRSLSVLTASKSLIYMTKLRITLEFTSQDRLATCIICLNDFNNQEELIGHMNISP